MDKEQVISPISIDLGAKNTGVYFAHYKDGSSIEDIEKEGKVYQLERDSYTLLMANRTARRHQRRGYDRRQMVKRLFKLIWEERFGLVWNKDVQQTISFLFNRRGFSFLTEEYDAEILSRFPGEAYQLLPDELQIDANDNDEYDFASQIHEWAREGEDKVKEVFDVVLRKAYYEKTRRCCQEKKTDDAIIKEGKNSVKLSDTPKDIFEELFYELPEIKNRIEEEEYTFENDQNEKITARYNKGETFNILSFINNNAIELATVITSMLPQEQKEWLFNPTGSFDLEKSREKLTKSEKIDIKLHLQHLAFALHKTLDELKSGGRHRSKYFEEIEAVLKSQNHTHGYLKEFCGNLEADNYRPLKVETLTTLIAHLSNFELRPLRKYFNDKKHKNGDYWDEERLKGIFDNWILREWRISPEKDKDKVKSGEGEYKKLCEYWKAHNGSIVDFWLITKPFYTIPPYQDSNNRRPPRCQSLVLNPTYLDNRYGEWQTWLETLKELPTVQAHLGDFECQLEGLKGGKGKPYFSENVSGNLKKASGCRTRKDLDSRILQFIFDRAKADDPLNLNEIYSHAKKYRQQQSTRQEKADAKGRLEQAIKSSDLPDTIKTPRSYQNSDVFEQGSFLHLTRKYYKIRQRAKDGRVFIHPEYRYVKGRGYENTGRFDDKNCLLTYCNHKPRQKRYQMLEDLAQILFTNDADLQKKMGVTDDLLQDKDPRPLFEKIENFFNIKDGRNSLKVFMENCAKAQKDYRNALSETVDSNYKKYEELQIKVKQENETRGRQLTEKKLKEEAKKRLIGETVGKRGSSNQEDTKKEIDRLIDLKEKSPGFAELLAGQIHKDLSEDRKKTLVGKFDNPFSLAQIYNIVYKERNGYAKTCHVCSRDNSLRMDAVFNNNQQVIDAKASRLPAIPTRLIDGAVMRIARITASAIIKDKWPNIEKELNANKKVHVPVIIEANRFEFEPSREELVKKQRAKPRKGKALTRGEGQFHFYDKDERIKKAGQSICPYTGTRISAGAGEIDHIIPRKSRWGTLNDEANLIWASRTGNHHKDNTQLSLGCLNKEYKQALFPDKNNDTEIQNWIIEQIDGNGDNFTFGPYRSFINLEPKQQTAFRHALFLVGHPLQKKVLNAINNRNRTLVNGTQRYFAEVLANSLHKEAKRAGKQKLLSFDYYEVSADPNSSNVNVPSVRKFFENKKDKNGEPIHPELQEHKKINGSIQEPYSHLIDATTAFMIALSEHYKDGSLKIRNPYVSPYDYSDHNGELKDLYGKTKIDYAGFKSLGTETLQRQIPKPEKLSVAHRPLFNDNAVAMHFLKLIEIKEPNKNPKYLKGFLALSELKKCLRAGNDSFEAYKKYASELSSRRKNKFLPLYIDKFAVGNGTGTSILTGFGGKQVTVNMYSLDKRKVFKFLIDHFNAASDADQWQREEEATLELLYDLWYFTQRQKIIVKHNRDKEKRYELKDEDKKRKMLINPQIEKAWSDLPDLLPDEDPQQWREKLKDYFLNKEGNGQRVPKHTHEHKRVAKEFSLPVSCQKGLLIRKKNWKGDDVYYCRPVSNDFSQTLLHTDQAGVIPDSDKDERLVNSYRQKNIFYNSNNFTKLKKELRPVDAALAIDPNKYYEAQIPQEFRDYLCKVENQRTDAERPRFRFYLKKKRMDFATFKKFIVKYPFRNLQDLKAELRGKWVEERISDPDSLKRAIEEVDKMENKPEGLLPTLNEIKTLYEESQRNQILAYSAKGKFTLNRPENSCP